MNILFVCSGNTCRSPMAEALLKKKIEGRSSEIQVRSAGLSAMGDPISAYSEKALKEVGLDHSKHISRRLNGELLQWADIVLTMTLAQKVILESMYPDIRVYSIKEYVGSGGDISDPFGQSYETYRRTREEIDFYVQRLADKLTEEK